MSERKDRFLLETRVNGKEVSLTAQYRETLLQVLRNRLGLTGAKHSCDMQVCGACTVLVDGAPVSSCTYLAYETRGREVTTIEGLGGADGHLHPVQEAFVCENGFQCGFCTPGMVLTTKVLLEQNPGPTDSEIREYLRGNICRCTGYEPIVESVKLAARKLAGEEGEGHGA